MTVRLKIRDLDCKDCARALERVASRIDGVLRARVYFTLSTLELELRPDLTPSAAMRALRRKGYEVAMPGDPALAKGRMVHGAISRRRLLLTALCGLLLLAAVASRLLGADPEITRALLVAATAAGLPLTLLRAAQAVRSLSIDMNVLMSIAVLAAALLGEWAEAGMVVFLFSIAVILEALVMARTRKAIERLMVLSPDLAVVRQDGVEMRVPAEEVVPGRTVLVKPGQRIPLEGEVIAGETSVDESAITGEPMPVSKSPGSPVFAGTLNEQGFIEIRVTKPKEESTLARIIHLVEHVEENRAPVERLVDRFARIYTPVVVAAAVVAAVLPAALGLGGNWTYRALVILIIACPCALVIATPVAVVSGLTAAARKGILIKGGAYLEQAARVRRLALDKTGTVTEGHPGVSEVIAYGESGESTLLRIAAGLESASNHPLAGAILAEARRRRIHFPAPEDAVEIAGTGIAATIESARYYVARPDFFAGRWAGRGYDPDALPGETTVLVADEDSILGEVRFEDALRPGVRPTLEDLKHQGIERVVLLTGDRMEAARRVAQASEIAEFHAALMPEEKVSLVREMRRGEGLVAMVGDGVNDAPALAAADVGIAMGAAGSDAAIDTADVALMSGDIRKLSSLFRIARRARSVVQQNIGVAIVIKAVFLALALGGRATMWMAVFADMGASLIVIVNAMRLLRERSDLPGD
jgi:Cd2+/Zn2+-exporting ATPase